MMGFGFLGLLLFAGVLLALLGSGAALISRKATDRREPGEPKRPTARQLQDERLARGEITQQEYDLVLYQIRR